MNEKENFKKIFNYFGYENQRRKLNEEVQELNDAILLYEKGIGDIENVIEEISDIKNVLESFKAKYDITENEIRKNRQYKVDRTIDRINSGYYGNGKSN